MSRLSKPLVPESGFFGVLGVGYIVWALILWLVLDGRVSDYAAIGVSGLFSLAIGLAFLRLGLKATGRPAMLAELRIFVLLELFFLVVTPVYWVMSNEITGSTALVLTFGLSTMLMAYLLIGALRHDPRPEDRLEAEIVEGAGELGFFPPKSAWPITAAAMATITLLGPVFGWWLTLLGVAGTLWATAGWVYQYYKGDYAH